MTSADWHNRAAFERHQTTQEELSGLLMHADRCLADGGVETISPETRHAALHNAVIYLARAALAASGYRTTESHHFRSIESLRHTVGLRQPEIEILQAHRKKRHHSCYDYDGIVSLQEVEALLCAAQGLRRIVRDWLARQHPGLA